jgi:membrane protease subunit (stomatin/prohibitin family)
MAKIISYAQRDGSDQRFIWRYPVSVPVATGAAGTTGGACRSLQLDVGQKLYAVLVKDGVAYDCLPMGKYPMVRERFPELAKAVPSFGEEPVFVDVFFLNTEVQWSLYFGTSNGPMHVLDPVCFVEYRLYLFGRLVLVPDDIRMFFQQVLSLGAVRESFSEEKLLNVCRTMINTRLEKNIGNIIKPYNLSILTLSYPLLSRHVRQTVEHDLKLYGLGVDAFYLDTLRVNDEDMSRCLKALQQLSMENVVEKYPVGIVKRTRIDNPSAQSLRTAECRFCHAAIPEVARFCPNCGQLVSGALRNREETVGDGKISFLQDRSIDR